MAEPGPGARPRSLYGQIGDTTTAYASAAIDAAISSLSVGMALELS